MFTQPIEMPNYVKESLMNGFKLKDKRIIQYVNEQWFKHKEKLI